MARHNLHNMADGDYGPFWLFYGTRSPEEHDNHPISGLAHLWLALSEEQKDIYRKQYQLLLKALV